jgi:uncharacterized protein (TIGR03085 family)
MTSDPGAMPPFVVRERHELADLLDEVGPDAPTLCTGWATRDLVAHLVLRESHPAALGIAFGPAAAWTRRTQHSLAAGDYPELVRRFREGPPTLSPMRLPGADRAANLFEHLVHHEDVRRAADDWQPRPLAEQDQHELWERLNRVARWYLRSAPVSVELVSPGHGMLRVERSGGGVTLTGDPAELVIYVHGRQDHAQVDVTGADVALAAWADHRLSV